MYDRILIPTDGSDPSERAAEHAVDLAAEFEAAVDVLFVVDEAGPGSHWDVAVERQEETGERAIDAVREIAVAADISIEPHLRRGTPYEEIVAAANEYGSALVVMGTHGRRGFDRLLTAGSTTERVVRLSTVPVLVVGGAGTTNDW